ncbi:hypothetical protein ACFQ4L_02830 [Lapidilactobacillus mulanensis]|uniref:Uncharacterized protein n=1 Tax=Lapidilactobacillus mulanensis TaxID=2485999 RepID=A0ABW4DQ12_9LACO|nr:hypothetical protein [Lapidilactobacillus mulanensis]
MSKIDEVIFQASLTANGELKMMQSPAATPEVMVAVVGAILKNLTPKLTQQQSEHLFNQLLLDLSGQEDFDEDDDTALWFRFRAKDLTNNQQTIFTFNADEIVSVSAIDGLIKVELNHQNSYVFFMSNSLSDYKITELSRAEAKKELIARGARYQVYEYHDNRVFFDNLLDFAVQTDILTENYSNQSSPTQLASAKKTIDDPTHPDNIIKFRRPQK